MYLKRRPHEQLKIALACRPKVLVKLPANSRVCLLNPKIF
jgi:hypothetical protein